MENLQPKLRFPEFEDEWKYKYLKDIGDIVGGGTPSTTVDKYWNGNINWFTPTEINSKYVTSSKRKITELAVSKSSAKILPKGSILLTTRATIGECSICLEESTTNQGFQSIVVNSFNSNEFVYYLINTTKNELIKKSSGSTFLEISKKKIETIEQYFPSLPEQTKIADFLGAVDKQIETLNTKKEKLTLYKKGVMQKLFSQEIRFKKEDNTNYPEWQEKTLGEIAKINSGSSPTNLISETGLIPYFKVEQLNNCVKYQLNTEYFISETKKIIPKNSIIFPKRGASILLNKVRILGVDGFMDTNMMSLTFKENSFEFMYYLLIYKNLSKIADTTSIPQINNKHIEPYIVSLPSLEEQTKIADFLSAIDNQIEAVNNQITKTENYKKGLLQQMFV